MLHRTGAAVIRDVHNAAPARPFKPEVFGERFHQHSVAVRGGWRKLFTVYESRSNPPTATGRLPTLPIRA